MKQRPFEFSKENTFNIGDGSALREYQEKIQRQQAGTMPYAGYVAMAAIVIGTFLMIFS